MHGNGERTRLAEIESPVFISDWCMDEMEIKPVSKYLVRAVIALTCLLPTFVFAETAHNAVRTSTDMLLKKLEKVQPFYESDPERFFKEVEMALDPHVDFASLVRGVMAKHYRGATPAQRKKFELAFRRTFVRTYGKALLAFDNQQLVVIPPETDGRSDKAVVELELHSHSGAVYPFVYQMIRRDGKWRLRNVIISGVNIGLQFRGQFASAMHRYQQDIDRVIETWSFEV